MIEKLYCYIEKINNPYHNLAIEEYLLDNVPEKSCILYLWQNRHTVVIGRNQNCWKECKVEELRSDGGFLARRLSGGGAVYHDMGNLNFTFLVNTDDYDLEKQLEVIIRAVGKLGIKAEKSGRNDILADGRKFSGNAFYNSGGKSYHHGTLLVNVDTSALSKYLNVDLSKLKAKGVESVRSRVANLTELKPDITVEAVSQKLIEAFGEVYGFKPEILKDEIFDDNVVETLKDNFSSWDWLYGKKLEFTSRFSHRFAWGDADMRLLVEGGKVKEAQLYSDAMDESLISQIPSWLKGSEFSPAAMIERLERKAYEPGDEEILKDIRWLIMQQFI